MTRGDYALGMADRLRIAREEWSQVVRPRVRLRMAVVVHESVSRCPFCGLPEAAGQENLTEDGLVIW